MGAYLPPDGPVYPNKPGNDPTAGERAYHEMIQLRRTRKKYTIISVSLFVFILILAVLQCRARFDVGYDTPGTQPFELPWEEARPVARTEEPIDCEWLYKLKTAREVREAMRPMPVADGPAVFGCIWERVQGKL
jgi:hypothetical protein